MAVIGLHPGSVLRSSPGQATVSWAVTGCPAHEVVLDVVQLADRTRPAVAIRRTGVNELLVADLPLAIALVARPLGSSVFPDGVTISGEIALRVGGTDGDQYVLPRADVSGTASTVMVTLTPAPDAWEVAVPADVVVRPIGRPQSKGSAVVITAPEVTEEQPGQDLVQRTSYAVRRRVGQGQLPVDRRTELHVAVDRSASLLPFVRSGAAQSVLEVLLGYNAVCGRDTEVAMWELGARERRVQPSLSMQTVSGYWERVLGEQASTGGTLLAPLVLATATSSVPRTVVVISDGVPGDVHRAGREIEAARSSGTTTQWHLLLFARGPEAPEVLREPWRDETVPLAELRRTGVLGLTSVSVGRGLGWLAERLAARAALEAMVRTLPLPERAAC